MVELRVLVDCISQHECATKCLVWKELDLYAFAEDREAEKLLKMG